MHDDFPSIDEKLLALGRRGYKIVGSIEVTHRCNAACRYCYIDHAGQTREMSTVQVKSAVDKLYDLGVVSIGITGGEPCMRADLPEIMEYTFKKGFYFVTLLTNGTLLSPELLALFGKYSDAGAAVRMSVFSLDAARHDAFMGLPGALRRIIDNGEKLIKGGVATGVLMNALPFNLQELKPAKLFFEQKGFKFSVGYEKTLIDPATYDLQPAIQPEFFLRFMECAPKKAVDHILQAFINRMASDETEEGPCQKIVNDVTVLPNGDLAPCISFRNFTVGNCIADSRGLREILETSAEYKKLRALRRRDIDQCRECKFLKYCTICPGIMHTQTGSFLRPPEQVCNFAAAINHFYEHAQTARPVD